VATDPRGVPGFATPQLEADALRRLIDTSAIPFVRLDRQGRVVFASSGLLALLGQANDAVLGGLATKWLPDEVHEEFLSTLAGAGPYFERDILLSLISSNGRRLRLVWRVRLVHLANGTPEFHAFGTRAAIRAAIDELITASGSFADAFDRPLAQAPGLARLTRGMTISPAPRLAPGPQSSGMRPQSGVDVEEMLALLNAAEQMNESASCVADIPGEFVWSDNLFRLVGLPVPEPGKSRHVFVEDYAHPDDMPWLAEKLYETLLAPGTLDLTVRFVRTDGVTRYWRCRGESRKLRPEDTRPTRMSAVVQDITSEVMARRALDTLSRVGAVLARASNRSDLLHHLCDTIVREGAYRYAAFLVPTAGGPVRTAHAGTSAFIEREVRAQAARALTTGKTVLLPEGNVGVLGSAGPAAAFLPVHADGDVAGVLALWSEDSCAFEGSASEHLLALAEAVGHALTRVGRDPWLLRGGSRSM
jgi:PAS domain-containing protein